MSKFGDFGDFCRNSNLVVCNLFEPDSIAPKCVLTGFETTNGHRIANLGKISAPPLLVRLAIRGSLLTASRGYDIMFYCGLYIFIPLSSNGEKKGCRGYGFHVIRTGGLISRATGDGVGVTGIFVN
jgi:Chitin synthase export chaperone